MSTASVRQDEVRRAANEIVDPCSVAMRAAVGITDLGIVETVAIDGGAVRVDLLLTSPHCLYVGHFQNLIEAKVGALPWVDSVDVRLSDSMDIWDEGRMSDAARRILGARRQRTGPRYLNGAAERAS